MLMWNWCTKKFAFNTLSDSSATIGAGTKGCVSVTMQEKNLHKLDSNLAKEDFFLFKKRQLSCSCALSPCIRRHTRVSSRWRHEVHCLKHSTSNDLKKLSQFRSLPSKQHLRHLHRKAGNMLILQVLCRKTNRLCTIMASIYCYCSS